MGTIRRNLPKEAQSHLQLRVELDNTLRQRTNPRCAKGPFVPDNAISTNPPRRSAGPPKLWQDRASLSIRCDRQASAYRPANYEEGSGPRNAIIELFKSSFRSRNPADCPERHRIATDVLVYLLSWLRLDDTLRRVLR